MFGKAKSEEKKKLFFLRGDFRSVPNKNVQMLDHFFPLFFPKDSESLKLLDIRLREVGANRPSNGTSKVNRQTDKQTDILTYRKHRPRGPMLWKRIVMLFILLNNIFLRVFRGHFKGTFWWIWEHIIKTILNFNFNFKVLAQKCLKSCVNGIFKFQFFFLNLSSKVLAGVRVRTSKYPYMDIREMTLWWNKCF